MYPLGHLAPNSVGESSAQNLAKKRKYNQTQKRIDLLQAFFPVFLGSEFVRVRAVVGFHIGLIVGRFLHW